MKLNDILIQPKITEKAMDKTQSGVYVFEVNKRANKNQVREAVQKLFGVEVSSVRTFMRKGKERKVGKRMKTKHLSDSKIAHVKVTKGKIDIFPQT